MEKSVGRKRDQGSRGLLERIEDLKKDAFNLAFRAPTLADNFKGKGGLLDGKGTHEGHRKAAEDLNRMLKNVSARNQIGI